MGILNKVIEYTHEFLLRRKKDQLKFIEQLKLFIFLNEKNLIDEKNGIINIYSFFLKAISKNLKVDDLYNNIPKYIQNYLLDNKNNINENDVILLQKFKENILNVKLELFKNIENNKNSFKEFQRDIKDSNLQKYFEIIEKADDNLSDELKNKIKIENLKKDENNSKLLALSFYFYQNNINNIDIKDNNIEDSIIKAKNHIDKNLLNNFTINNNQLNMLSSFDNDFSFGFEYEFWINSKYLKENLNHYITEISNNSITSLNAILKILDLDINLDVNLSSDKKIYKYKETKIILENNEILNIMNKNNQQYFEIVSKKFNSISEMLVFNDFTLNLINNIKINDEKDILVSEKQIEKEFKENNNTKIVTNFNMVEEVSKKQDRLFDNFPGSIHFNISNPNIQNINKIKFFLLLKEKELMLKWKIRNDNVKDLSSLVDVFGPFIIESDLVDKLWQINFSYLDKPDKNNIIIPRLEIRYMGGFDYPTKINEINLNILNIMECVNKSMNKTVNIDKGKINEQDIDKENKNTKDTKNNSEYLDLLIKYDVDRNWNDLNKNEQELCFKIFKTNDLEIVLDRFKKLKEEVNKKKEIYYGIS